VVSSTFLPPFKTKSPRIFAAGIGLSHNKGGFTMSDFLDGFAAVMAPWGTVWPASTGNGIILKPKSEIQDGRPVQTQTPEEFVASFETEAGIAALQEMEDVASQLDLSLVQHLELDREFDGKAASPLVWVGAQAKDVPSTPESAVSRASRILHEALGSLI
jgi:hypothetical protein